MRVIRIFGFVAFVAIALIALHGVLPAQKKGKPGGNVPGTVYFAWSDLANWGWFTYVMDANGNQQGHLPVSAGVINLEPSDALHVDTANGNKEKRWFLYLKENEAPKEGNELWAISDDAMHDVCLTDDSDPIFVTHATRRWTVDPFLTDPAADTYVCYVGKEGTPPVRNIYGLRITWTAGIPARSGASEILLDPSPSVDIPTGTTIGDFDWAHKRLVYVLNGNQLHVKDMTVAPPLSYDLTIGDQPEWAPDGGKIAFRMYDADVPKIATVNPDPNNLDLQILASGNNSHNYASRTVVSHPKWAPTSAHLVYLVSLASISSNREPHIYRMTAAGQNKTSLTKSLDTDVRANPIPLGWR